MISVHERAATDFEGNGLGVLDREIIEPVVTEELDGAFSLSFIYPADGPLAAALKLENIVVCLIPGGYRQGFRIHQVQTRNDRLLEVTCFHVFYDLAANLIADTNIINKTAREALNQLLAAANTPHGFTASSSDRKGRASARIVRTPLAAAILDKAADNSFISRWGGHITRDNWSIHHTPTGNGDGGVVIRDRKNLTGYKSEVDLTSVVTRIVPVGFDGLLLPELYVDSPRISDYVAPHIRVMRYGHVKAIKDSENPREDELPLDQAYEQLRHLAKAEYEHNRLDQPAASYKVSFVELTSTREYADLAQLETVYLGDTVTVRHSDLGVALKAQVIAYEFNPLTGQYLSVQLGSAAPKFSDITRQIHATRQAADMAGEVAGFALASADGKTTNHYGSTQPASARLGDTWFRDNGEKTEIWIYATTDAGKPGWVAVATDLNQALLKSELDGMRTQVKQATDNAKTATDQTASITEKVDNAVSDAATAKQQAQQASSAAVENARELAAYKVTVTNNLAGVSSQLTQLATDINLRVSKAGIISQINVSPETILIDAGRIHLSGQTTIDDGVIKTAMIADLAVTSAKIAYLSADKITTGTLSAARIAAGSITSDKLTIANGFIKNAMIANAAVTDAKIANLDAAKITTGYLNTARIQARSITADKLAANAIQVGLAGWNQSIRISPYEIAWFNGSTLEGKITSRAMEFWYGSRRIGELARGGKKDAEQVQGISMSLGNEGDYVAWTYQTTRNGAYYTCLTLDPKGKFYGQTGIHLGADLRTNGYKFYTTGNRYLRLQDCSLSGRGTHPGWVSPNGLAKVVFHTYDVMIVTNGSFYNMSRLFDRVNDLMNRVNSLIRLLNQGWITSISGSGSNISWRYFDNTGLSAMQTGMA
ncbi:phage tail spike protein [Actinotignum sp. GS-2025e]|uniref:phage tail spike protein n=1 Tax=Actinotignum sp. GS-2025e TaxID=3427278 RepID=UPI003F476774